MVIFLFTSCWMVGLIQEIGLLLVNWFVENNLGIFKGGNVAARSHIFGRV